MSIHAENAARICLREREIPVKGWMVAVDDVPFTGTVYADIDDAIAAAENAARHKEHRSALVHVLAVAHTLNLVCTVKEIE
jgi:hypothetical protein